MFDAGRAAVGRGFRLLCASLSRRDGTVYAVGRALAVARGHHGKLASQHLSEEVAVVVRRLQEPGVNALRLGFHHVKHGVHLALVGEDLANVLNALL